MLSKTERKGELANVYLDPDQRFWHDVLRSYDDPWELVDCPVDASLEHRLWDEWTQSFNAGEYETCASQATQRHDRLDATYGDVPWTQVWEQAVDVATLAAELETWEERAATLATSSISTATSRTVPGRLTTPSSTSSSPASRRPGS